ncbi:MAG: glucose-1-phosphate adenylyltransferase [Gammaproteobacteria bacterium]|nr:glucose-1-phosphate adenylyltransferase [Gammaproteobacteria bacterium]
MAAKWMSARESQGSASLVRRAYGIVLAGGRGTRLGPLTDWRAKPAVPFGGKLRIIDFPLSNCVNSGIRRIGVVTQYKAQSLIRHLQHGWNFLDADLDEFVEVIPAQQRLEERWYQGTADAVFQNIDILRMSRPEHVIVLAGDHVYMMDYSRMLVEHVDTGADLTIACTHVPLAEARCFGVVAVDADDRIVEFEEKPAVPAPDPARPDSALISMGIYVFDASLLYSVLADDASDAASRHDFGLDLIPRLLRSARVVAHRFENSCMNTDGNGPYWRDVGTVDAYWSANLDLVSVTPSLNLYDERWPIRTLGSHLPPAKFVFDDDDRRGMAVDSIVSSGCIISGGTVRRSLLSTKVRVQDHALVEDSVILPEVDVGRNVTLKRTIVDKGCRIPEGMVIGVDPSADRARFHVTDQGVTLITAQMLGMPPPSQYRQGDRQHLKG